MSAEVRSPFLWQHGASVALERVHTLLFAFVAVPFELAVTRVDLTVDFQGWVPEFTDVMRFRALPRKRRQFFDFPHLTGMDFGAGGEVMARLYDKTREIQTESPDKAWFREVWARAPGYEPDAPVWRLEYQLRREGFRSFRTAVGRLDTWSDVESNARALWAFLTSKWLRIPGQRTKASKAPNDPAWDVLHREGFTGDVWRGAGGDLTRKAREQTLSREDTSFGGQLARAIGRAKLVRPEVTGDEAVAEAVRRAAVAVRASKGVDLEELGEERAQRHRARVSALLDAAPPIPEVPQPEPPEAPPAVAAEVLSFPFVEGNPNARVPR